MTTVSKIKSDIVNKTLQHFYIFAGDEYAIQDIYIKHIAEAQNLTIKRIESIKTIYSTLKNKSFLNQRFLYVCRDDGELLTDEDLWSRIHDEIFGDHIYILQLTNIDKRTKFYKAFADDICVFEQLEPRVLKKYLQKEVNLSDKNCQRLMEICEYNYGRCLLEIDKIQQYEKSIPIYFADDAFKLLTESGTIYTPPRDAIFDFVDAVLKRNVRRTFALLEECYNIGEATLVMLSVLFGNAKAVLQVQNYSGDNLSKATGLSAWEIRLAKDRVGYYKDWELIDMLCLIQRVESRIKSGKIDEDIAMNYLLTEIL